MRGYTLRTRVWKRPGEKFVRFSARSECARVWTPARPQAKYTDLSLTRGSHSLSLSISLSFSRPRRFKRFSNEVWSRKHGTYIRARTARRSGNASFDYPEGYETNQAAEYARIFRCISHGGGGCAAGVSPPEKYFFVLRDCRIA